MACNGKWMETGITKRRGEKRGRDRRDSSDKICISASASHSRFTLQPMEKNKNFFLLLVLRVIISLFASGRP